MEAAASDATAAKSALENAIKHSDDEVRKVRDRTNGEKAEPSGKAVDDEVRKASEEEGLDSEQIAADAEARREVVLSSASRRDRDDLEASSSRSREFALAANASNVVAMADEKIHELNDAKAKVETEAEQALETAVTAEGVDETLASELARALANLTGSE